MSHPDWIGYEVMHTSLLCYVLESNIGPGVGVHMSNLGVQIDALRVCLSLSVGELVL